MDPHAIWIHLSAVFVNLLRLQELSLVVRSFLCFCYFPTSDSNNQIIFQPKSILNPNHLNIKQDFKGVNRR